MAGAQKRPLDDYAPEVVVVAKQFATAITAHNVKASSLRGEVAITHERLVNTRTVRSGLQQQGIGPELLEPEEDMKKVERRHASDAKKLASQKRAAKKR